MSLEEEKNFEKARKQLVVKRIDAIQLGRNSFSLVEQKAVNYMVSKIKPNDSPDKEYIFNIREFCRMIQWHRTPTQDLLEMLQTLANKSWWIKSGKEGQAKYDLKHWFDVVRVNEGTGTISITFSKTVQPYLFNLIEQQKRGKIYLASWTADAISLMKNKYTPKIFELLRTYQFNNVKWEFENGTGTERDLQVIIADRDEDGHPKVPKGWANWATFQRDVLIPAREEINKYTDLMIEFDGLKTDFAGKKYRKYVRIVFWLDEKTEEEKMRKDHELAVAYDNEIVEQDYQQLSLGDYASDFETRRKYVHSEEEEIKKEERINKSKHPAFLEEMEDQGFDEKYIDKLYITAKCKFFEVSDVVRKSNEELWITDYVSMHLNSMRSSGIETISNEKARLYDLVENDYKNYAQVVTNKYYYEGDSYEKPIVDAVFTEPQEEKEPDNTVSNTKPPVNNDEELEAFLLGLLTKNKKER